MDEETLPRIITIWALMKTFEKKLSIFPNISQSDLSLGKIWEFAQINSKSIYERTDGLRRPNYHDNSTLLNGDSQYM